MECEIPVSFEYEGIQFDGYFTSNYGSGNHLYLRLNGRQYGSLVIKENRWQWFAGPMNLFNESYMLEYFEQVVLKWYDSKIT